MAKTPSPPPPTTTTATSSVRASSKKTTMIRTTISCWVIVVVTIITVIATCCCNNNNLFVTSYVVISPISLFQKKTNTLVLYSSSSSFLKSSTDPRRIILQKDTYSSSTIIRQPTRSLLSSPTSFNNQRSGGGVSLPASSSDESESSVATATTTTTTSFVGDDSAYFDIQEQDIGQWVQFSAAVAAVLGFVAYSWFLPFGWHGGDVFLSTVQNDILHTTDPAWTVTMMLGIFALAHSGLAALRTYAEPIVGARPWRVLFAIVSLPLALSCISYFINHAHEGIQLWDVMPLRGTMEYDIVHAGLWILNFISFLFLYPSTFDLLSIAAINKPILRLWETGIIRITRHPQATGQVLWCLGHTIYLGSSTAVAASAILILHHIFACYHGDRRLENKYGDDFQYIKERTSIVPFAAIFDGRQQLPSDYYKEFLRVPYAVVIAGTIIAYYAHPFLQAGAALLHW